MQMSKTLCAGAAGGHQQNLHMLLKFRYSQSPAWQRVCNVSMRR